MRGGFCSGLNSAQKALIRSLDFKSIVEPKRLMERRFMGGNVAHVGDLIRDTVLAHRRRRLGHSFRRALVKRKNKLRIVTLKNCASFSLLQLKLKPKGI
ncbi:unnamed protein product [Microthlaspi erraticum]|uniref:Uncharacterized protein n=1 Tax=Microthlaspi erraticum TaxID=1685480 RepID=A0A6D2HIV5_9BRAS|nr:unnamed protein product [Microthlaspi erraticum]